MCLKEIIYAIDNECERKFQYLGGVLEYKSLIADSNPLDTSLQVSIHVAF